MVEGRRPLLFGQLAHWKIEEIIGLCFVHGGLHWFREDVRYYLDHWLIGKLRKSLGGNELYLDHSGPHG